MKITKESILKSVLTMPIPTWLKQVFILILEYIGEFSGDLSNKADLIGGKIPESQLPSYVDDVIEYYSISYNDLDTIPGNLNYKNRIYWVYNTGSEYSFKFINTNQNRTKNDWTISDPEQGKIYVNLTNNHSYRWAGTALLDLDKEFTDGIASLQNALLQLNINTVTDINDLSGNTSSQNTLNLLYNNVLKPTDSVTFRNPFIRFTYNNNQYAYPIFDRDPVNKTFKVYNHGNLQTYKILLDGSTYSMEKVQDIPGYVMLGDTDSKIDNKAVLDTLKEYEIINCVFNYSGTYILGVLKKEASLSFFSAFDGRLIKTITINSTNGAINVLTNVGTDQLLSFSAYTSYGGKKNVSDFYYTMAAQFTANSVVINNSDLGKVVSDATLLARIKTASQLIVNDVPNNNSPTIFIRGRETITNLYFINIEYVNTYGATVRLIDFSITNNILSIMYRYGIDTAFNIYIINGGTKNRQTFNETLAAQFEANAAVIDNADLNKVVTDTNLVNKILKASYLIVTNVPNNVAPIVFTAGLETSAQIIFNNVLYFDGKYISLRRINFTKTDNKLSYIVSGGLRTPFSKYESAGGTKTEAEFYTKLVLLIDAEN